MHLFTITKTTTGDPDSRFSLEKLNTIMGRVNKTIDGVFTDIVGTSKEISSYSRFVNQGKNLNSSKQLKNMTKLYEKMVNDNKDQFEKLAQLEEIIMQMRIRENMDGIKLSLVREYIYARVPFYRRDKKAKDVRVIVNKVDFYPGADQDLSILSGNPEFMEKAKNKLIEAIDDEINENLSIYGLK